MGEIIQLQGDQRDNVKAWLIKHEILTTKDLDRLVIHGY
jgi:translation initiation factor 1 (eIF-1/SUI1)